jgi:hypothetical protein
LEVSSWNLKKSIQLVFGDLLCLVPRVRDPRSGCLTPMPSTVQFGGAVLDHGENLRSEPPDQLLGEDAVRFP